VTGVLAYTDGACAGNPGPGGWGVLLQAFQGARLVKERELSGGVLQTTNNRMELTAAIEALESLSGAARITIITDSAYVKEGITQWLPRWKQRGWRTAQGKPVKNLALWQRLEAAQQPHRITWRWVKGHAGHPENERAHALAQKGLAPFKTASVGNGARPGP